MNKKKSKDSMMEALSKNLHKAEPTGTEVSTKVHSQSQREIQDDYEFSRKVYKDLIDKGTSAMDMMMDLAADSEHPRAYEVLAKLMKDIGDTTDKLMDLQSKKKEINRSEGGAAKPIGEVTNNNVFIGSTADLQRMLIDANKDAIDIDGSAG